MSEFNCYTLSKMIVVHVHIHVKPDSVEAFKQASIENATQSVREPGIARFDVLQQSDDPTRFLLVEVYRTAEAPAQHKETAHYAAWRDAVAPMMAQPRTSFKFGNVHPPDEGW
jgi:quinol monooxygenase YgiN